MPPTADRDDWTRTTTACTARSNRRRLPAADSPTMSVGSVDPASPGGAHCSKTDDVFSLEELLPGGCLHVPRPLASHPR